MKYIKLFIKYIACSFLFVFFLSAFSTYAEGPGEHSKTIAVIGDSYAVNFGNYISAENLKFYYFPVNGLNKNTNISLFRKCIQEEDNSYILFCAGVNDYILGTSPKDFETYIKVYANLAKRHGKYIFFHTYMDFPDAKDKKNRYLILEYNNIYKKVANEFANAFYIDMGNLQNENYSFGDGTNYGKLFYDTLFAKLNYQIDSIESTLYTTYVPWVNSADKDALAITGDSYADAFIEFEKDKAFNFISFTKSDMTLEDIYSLAISSMISNAKYALISIGINDYEKQTDPFVFEQTLRQIINISNLTHKKVFLHSYMFYQTAENLKIKIAEYDSIIKKLADEYQNTIYINTHSYEMAEYQMSDLKRFGKEFNDKIYDTIFEYVKKDS